ncbi:DNA-binding LacI/PurR family transcriptional regulator [Deinococcus metalli]|uniref:Transcriptional regulator n=1 Tax=Deinococcus metalli TaxID=1141878 RepID=A0A7W8KEK5_9DEIO|nr:LacI family DNA-binding transcriptional regulator [Deinococcus metalli]MBB5376706.1 DNA-binding LacI/PurR family transcriptional regulator [Deinococcus metalli]GHF44739.1 transcriptional regulator [Deinococcus metalli]
MPPAKPSAKAPPRGGRITLREVARALGVSVATVSNAYNRPDQLSQDLRERILETAQRLGYRGPDPLARSLRRGRTGVVGVVYDAPLEYAFADPAAAMFLGSVAHAIQEQALNLLLLASPGDALPVRSASVDAFIVYCAAEDSDLLSAVLDRGLPTVLVDQYAHPQAVQIGIDDAGGAREAARHLRDLGHAHIGVVCLELGPERHSGPVTPERERATSYRTTAERLLGYRTGAQGAALYPVETEQNTPQEGELRTLDLLAAHPQITAVLCMSDVLAQGALRAAQGLGRSVPGDLSIIGYDDLPSSSALGLTTVWQPTADKGRHVGETLLSLLGGAPAENVTLPTRLVVRGSTAGPGGAR